MKSLEVEVAWASPVAQGVVSAELPPGATVADAVAAVAALERAQVAPRDAGYAIHGQAAGPETPLRDGDRIEITRALQADAKEVRRARAKDKVRPSPGDGRKREPGA